MFVHLIYQEFSNGVRFSAFHFDPSVKSRKIYSDVDNGIL